MIKYLAQRSPVGVDDIVWPTHNPAFNDLPSFANLVLTWFLGFMGAFAVLAVIYSGIMFLTAGGNSDQAEKAKKNLTWAIIGVVLVAFSSTIVWWVNNILNNAG